MYTSYLYCVLDKAIQAQQLFNYLLNIPSLMMHYTALLGVSTIVIYTALTCSFVWLTIILLAGAFVYSIREVIYSVRKQSLICLIQQMTFVEFSKLYNPKIMQTGHRIYDHAQVLLSLAKWADAKVENESRFYEQVLARLEHSTSNSAMMDIILTMTYLLACKKDPTMEEIQSLIGEPEFTNYHISAYTLYTDIINECTTLKTVITVNDTGKDWHIDDAVALFILFDILMLVKSPDICLYIIGAGRDPEAATHNHKVLATGILGDEIRKVIFLNSPGVANEAVTGIQHVVRFEKNGKLPSTCNRSETLLDLHHVDIVAFCAETSCIEEIIHINAVVGGIQGGFEKSTHGTYKGFNALQSHKSTMVLEDWTTKINNSVCATKTHAANLSLHGTDMFNKLLQIIGIFSIDMQLFSLLKRDPICYDGIRDVIPDLLVSNRLYDEMTPLLVLLGILHNPSVWILSIPGMRDQLTNPTMINISAAFIGKGLKRKLLLLLLIFMIKTAFMF